MILQALKEYYDRKSADPESGIAPPGWEWKEVPYIAVLNKKGELVDLLTTVEGSGKTKTTRRFLLPQSVKRSSGIAANLLWDVPEYVFGLTSLKANPSRVPKQHEAFVERVEGFEIKDDGLDALKIFLKRDDKQDIIERFSGIWETMQKDDGYVVFRVEGTGHDIVSDSPAIKRALTSKSSKTGDEAFCILSGESDEIERLHASIKGIWGGNSTGGSIVSFNADAFESYGKEQGENAPSGKRAVFAYTTALNTMLAKGSKNRMQVGDASTIAWASKDTNFESNFFAAWCEPDKDNPDAGVEAVEQILKAVESGAYHVEKDPTKFYVLGLAPNAARISIRFWQESTLEEIAVRTAEHFKATEVVRPPKQPKYLSLFRLLISTATQGKSENIPPNLAGEVMRTILAGQPYPRTLLQAAIRRNRAEQQVGYYRAAIIKACLNKSNSQPPDFKELTVSLDKENTNIGYLLGRLFAVLEKIQSEANPGINATIRDRFYGAASGTPASVFSNLMRLKNHHLSKLENVGRRINFERLIGEIVGGIPGDPGNFPSHLSLENQGCFAIGYYHQVQDFFTKKEKSDKPAKDAVEEPAKDLLF